MLLLLLLLMLYKLNKQSLAQFAAQLKAVKILSVRSLYHCVFPPSFDIANAFWLSSSSSFGTNFKIIFTHECIRNFALQRYLSPAHLLGCRPGNVFSPKAIAFVRPSPTPARGQRASEAIMKLPPPLGVKSSNVRLSMKNNRKQLRVCVCV